MPAVVDEAMVPAAPKSPEDLGAVFAILRTGLHNYLRRRVSDPAVAEDLVQDVFIKALAAISANRTPRNLTGWLYAAARTTVADYYRSMPSSTAEIDENLPDARAASDELLHQELSLCIKPLVLRLPSIYRETLLAADFDGKSMRSIAAEQGLSLSAVKTRASRARSMLKDKLLACCHVEMSNGMVTDYHRRASGRCGGACT